jgi:hypothetical protein
MKLSRAVLCLDCEEVYAAFAENEGEQPCPSCTGCHWISLTQWVPAAREISTSHPHNEQFKRLLEE